MHEVYKQSWKSLDASYDEICCFIMNDVNVTTSIFNHWIFTKWFKKTILTTWTIKSCILHYHNYMPWNPIIWSTQSFKLWCCNLTFYTIISMFHVSFMLWINTIWAHMMEFFLFFHVMFLYGIIQGLSHYSSL